jgi:hypothetical protein
LKHTRPRSDPGLFLCALCLKERGKDGTDLPSKVDIAGWTQNEFDASTSSEELAVAGEDTPGSNADTGKSVGNNEGERVKDVGGKGTGGGLSDEEQITLRGRGNVKSDAEQLCGLMENVRRQLGLPVAPWLHGSAVADHLSTPRRLHQRMQGCEFPFRIEPGDGEEEIACARTVGPASTGAAGKCGHCSGHYRDARR